MGSEQELATHPMEQQQEYPSLTAGLQAWDEFCKERKIKRTTFWRWKRLGLPIVNIGREAFVDIAKARAWFEGGMKTKQPEPQRPRRRLRP
jgi:hypothetical protein